MANSQSAYFDCIFDLDEINNTIDSLKRNNINEIIVLKTELLKICKYSDDSVITITIWPSNFGFYNLKIISSNAIYRQIQCRFQDNIFNYKYRFDTFVSGDEDVLKFVAPTTNNNSVFYITKDKSGYFEHGDRINKSPVTYVPKNQTKEKYRNVWFDQIIINLDKVQYDLIIDKVYTRHKENE